MVMDINQVEEEAKFVLRRRTGAAATTLTHAKHLNNILNFLLRVISVNILFEYLSFLN